MFPLPRTYTYPDGTKSVNRPSDGQVFYIWDVNNRPVSTWQWDDFHEQWFNITSGNPAPMEQPKIQLNLPICECGSEKVGSPRHSSWCQKYNQNQ